MTTTQNPTKGLYDPAFEHDACGIALVADLHGPQEPRPRAPGRDRPRAPGPPGGHRGRGGHRRRGRDPDPDAPPVPGRRPAPWTCPRPVATPRAWSSSPPTPTTRPRPSSALAELAAEENLACWPGATSPSSPECSGPRPGGPCPVCARWWSCPTAPARRSLRPRSTLWLSTGSPSACASGWSTRCTASTSCRCRPGPSSTRACSPREQLDPFFPDLSDETLRQRAGPRALPVLDQHLPVVAPGPPLPVSGPQRRDQHPAGEPQLDAGPRSPARERPHPRRPRAALPHLRPRGQRLGHLRRGARASAPGRPVPAPRRAHDDPRGVGEPRPDGRRPAATSTASTPRSWSRGTAPPPSSSPTAPWPAGSSTETACARRATG